MRFDITVGLRLAEGNRAVRDIYLIPKRNMDYRACGTLSFRALNEFRVESLIMLYEIARRVTIGQPQ